MEIKVVTNKKELNDAFSIREKVFIEEQNVPKVIEMDEYEEVATHFVVYDGNKPISTARFRKYLNEKTVKFERFAVLKEYRGQGVGRALIKVMEEEARKNGFTTLRLNAQRHAEGFYAKFGYQTISEPFDEAGIEHVTMIKKIEAK
ncbi:GNAT family N-acetyltransferase [Tepidibacillus fermentans]|uniref:Putative GNAT family N-acyltransferase n=1 Tax=Tepidibacillus fermentans TaxID=1281767 RepID=A0A4R3KKU2_9BACI|nr:GNAT family N-acetyltransferase [Tepidibacillus fermentans]TCS84521.1 putative GNAT family N-acyltransferase [Tepidibacillus fermentans]